MRIDYLANHIELAPVLAAWHHREWSGLLVDWSLEQAHSELRSHVRLRNIPTTFVALDEGEVIGSASLIESDLDAWQHLSPWLASVYVVEQHRGRGVGTQLIHRALEDARALGVPAVYLFTAGHEAYYARLGWVPIIRTTNHQQGIVIMQRLTDR
jgi:predicted N-acetyltransferase YhbS